jgi:hypothetical protein
MLRARCLEKLGAAGRARAAAFRDIRRRNADLARGQFAFRAARGFRVVAPSSLNSGSPCVCEDAACARPKMPAAASVSEARVSHRPAKATPMRAQLQRTSPLRRLSMCATAFPNTGLRHGRCCERRSRRGVQRIAGLGGLDGEFYARLSPGQLSKPATCIGATQPSD